MDRKGELTSQQLVTIIVLIISFGVILVFFFMLDFKSDVGKEACHNSVVLRGTSPLGKESVRLNCQTESVCLTRGAKCSAAPSDARIVKVNTKEELHRELGLMMYDCWWQMGQGKVDYQPKGWGDNNYCVICNRIYVDDSIKKDTSTEKMSEVSMLDFYKYLQTTKVPNGKQTYTQHLYGLSSLDGVNSALKEQKIDLYGEKYNLAFDKGYALVTSMKKGGSWRGAVGFGLIGAVAGIGIVAWPIGATSTAVIIGLGGGGGLTAGGIGGFAVSGGGVDYITPTYYPYTEQTLKELNCDEFSSLP